jgi:hypothetical protein
MPVLGAGTEVDNAAAVRHRNFLTLVAYAGDAQRFAEWVSLSSDSLAAWELDVESLTENRATRIENRLGLPPGWLSQESPEPVTSSIPSIEMTPVESENTVATRRANLQRLVGKAGTKNALAPSTGIAASNLSKVFKKDFSDYVARKIETQLGLPESWLDTAHDDASWEASVPESVMDKLNQISASRTGPGAPKKTPHKPAEHHSMSRPDHGGVSFGKNWPPLCRALVEKTVALIDDNKLTEDVAFALFGQLMQLERGTMPDLATSLPRPSATGAVTGTSTVSQVASPSSDQPAAA